jgi:hypothetical protein
MASLRNDMGMTQSAAGLFSYKFRKQGFKIATLSGMLHDAIQHHIDIYRTQSYAKFCLEIAVYPSDDAEPMVLPLRHFGAVQVGYDSYTFSPCHNDGPSKTLPVRLNGGRVQVQFCGSWRSISAYLDEVKMHRIEGFNAPEDLNRQLRWWKANGKSFDFQKLPGELRNTIFNHSLPDMIQTYPKHKSRGLSRLIVAPKNTLALMHANKQTHDELSHVLYQRKAFLIKHRPVMFKTVNNKSLQQNINHLTLNFSSSGYLDLFNFDWETDILPHKYSFPGLREMKLTTLEFHINAPSPVAEAKVLEGACQVSAVSLVFIVAWASIKGHPVKISGWIKDSQKKRIETHTNNEKLAYEQWSGFKVAASGEAGTLRQYDEFMAKMESEEQGGVRLDGKSWDETEVEGGLDSVPTHDNYTLKQFMVCNCSVTCEEKTWTCED